MARPEGDDFNRRYASIRSRRARFGAADVAELYRHRPPYSDEVVDRLLSLLGDHPQRVLDAGCGPGKLARKLVVRGLEVDAVDASAEMIRVGRMRRDGDHPDLHWFHGAVEQVPLPGGYGLAVAAASFHWFDADAVLGRLAELLHPEALLVIVDGDQPWQAPWEQAERAVLAEFLTRLDGRPPHWSPLDLEETRLLDHPRFALRGHCVTRPAAFRQRLEDYIACQHSRASFAPGVMGAALAAEFDAALAETLAPHADAGWIRFDRRTRMEWGRPR